ncbi:hypothetical protein DESUT3_40430 [Desulfuromonas versatilis]|uniref:Leucine-binding protein domain-containing protein n=1 Tax=Desulfuromonas versatilis TaxID=2802975 RepID=A0ABM8I1V8_9BACT|nr:penicillin-binding protein activator [Desulfuromonas versatilis]BCR06974.1 hypothetical protein DESUT3_40430 [Desulfuromonas versatilis]
MTGFRGVRLLVLAAAFWAVAASATAAGVDLFGERRPVTTESSLQQGIELYQAGRSEEALGLLRGFVVRNYNSPQLPTAYLYLGRIFFDQGRPDEALLYLERIPAAQRTQELTLLEGAALVHTGEAERGLSLLQQVAPDGLPSRDRALFYGAMAEAKGRQGRPLESLALLHQGLLSTAAPEAEKLLAQAHGLVQGQLSDAELAEAAFMFRGTPIGADVNLKLAEQALAGGDRQRAQQLADEAVRSNAAFPYRAEAASLLDRSSGSSYLQRAVGVLLPLSGRYATFGQLVRRGMELALEIHNQSAPAVQLLFRDSGAEPEDSAREVAELANGQRVMAIAGPLTGGAAAAAATRAQQERVPLLTLSQRDGLPETGPYVFRNSLTNLQQVQTLVRYAVGEKGLRRFAILFPENKLGYEFAELFSREVEAFGGRVVAREGYAEKATDFRRQVRLLKGENPDAPEKEAKPGQAPARPEAPFDALFIPDYADQVGLVAPQLAFYGLDKLPLLGINGWNSPDLLRVAGRYVEGAVFADGFFLASSNPVVREFVALYTAKYGEEPSILEAQGFDAAGILLSVLDRPEVRSREDLLQALTQLRDYPGVTGTTGFNGQGECEKGLFLLQVQNGEFRQIN